MTNGFSEGNEKEHIPDDPDLEPSSSDFSSEEKKRNKKKNVVNTEKMTRQIHH